MIKKEDIEIIGFDIDGTLYATDSEIDNRIRNKTSEYILKYRPLFKTLDNARAYFEEHYANFQSSRKVLYNAGFTDKEASTIMDQSIAEANVIDLIKEDQKLVELVKKISKEFKTYVLSTNSPATASKKLNRLGLSEKNFTYIFATLNNPENMGTKNEGSAFEYALKKSEIPAKNHLYVGNSLKADILPAQKKGMQTVGVGSVIPQADMSIQTIHSLEELLWPKTV